MNFNVFTKPKEAFGEAIESPNMAVALLTVIIAGVLIGIVSYALTSVPLAIIISVLIGIIQWLLMSVLLWGFGFMFSGKKKGSQEKSFMETASASGRLWILVVAAAALFNLAILSFMVGLVLLSAVFVILIFILFLMFIIASYALVKVVLDAERGRAIVAWLLLMVLAALIWAVAQLGWARVFA